MELSLPAGSDPKSLTELFELVMVRKGQMLSPLAVRRSLEGLWNTGRFADVVARVVEVPGGVRLVFQLTPVQRAHAARHRGQQSSCPPRRSARPAACRSTPRWIRIAWTPPRWPSRRPMRARAMIWPR